jgi:hypothetical protein
VNLHSKYTRVLIFENFCRQVWTAGALAATAPLLPLFSLPFWLVGGKLLKESASSLLAETTLEMGRDSFTLTTTGLYSQTFFR